MRASRRAFYEILAGLALLIVDFRNDAIVPDFLGYLLILFALRTLAPLDASFALGRWCAIVAAVASAIAMSSYAVWPALVKAFFEIVLIVLICTGVVHLAGDDTSLARSASNARSLTVVSGTLNFAYAALFYGFHIVIPNAAVVLLAFGWSVVVIVMLVMWHAANELGHSRG